ncbi:hypothetical protein P8C59_002926 [Phyllachora maydis]|uniref:tetrahydrofolate synthase n=1 Tax=Phyllachora maydis TaxID=1825666 RepID=A0AAD9HZL7_9PEZI|nr:hypothetical protein P8C59_002926 [Phyllachora maydis]
MASSPAPSRTYDDALRLLSELPSNKAITSLFTPSPSAPPLQELDARAMPEMTAWLLRAGYTPAALARHFRCVHVAGTKGKGSVATFTAAVLRRHPAAAGRVGTYTSPHVTSVRERIAIDGRPLDRALFTRYFFELWDALSAGARRLDARPAAQHGGGAVDFDGPATKPFYFRFLTLLAFHAFVREGVRSAVVECGIGGEYDPTNVLAPEGVSVAVVTQLGIDHVTMLGDTVPKIAWHKAGIFKKGVVALTRRLSGEKGGEVMEVLRQRAAEKGASKLVELAEELTEQWAGVPDAKTQQGPFQKSNMALAAMAAREHLLVMGEQFQESFAGENASLDAMPEEFVAGLREASIRGRCEILKDADGIEWFIDGAHTEDSLAGVGRWFASGAAGDGVRRILVFNQQDRDPTVLLGTLLRACQEGQHDRPAFHHAVFTRNEEDVSADQDLSSVDLGVQGKAQETMTRFDGRTETKTTHSVRAAVTHLRQRSMLPSGYELAPYLVGYRAVFGDLLKPLPPLHAMGTNSPGNSMLAMSCNP